MNSSPSTRNNHTFVNPKTVIKCKQCKDLFYIVHVNDHECFLKSNELIKRKKKDDEELDLTKHCGVSGCKYGLSCRSHSLEEKRQVEGRLYSLDLLVKIASDERKNKQSKDEQKKLIEIDEETKNIVLSIKPVIKKSFYQARMKHENADIKNLFVNLVKRGED